MEAVKQKYPAETRQIAALMKRIRRPHFLRKEIAQASDGPVIYSEETSTGGVAFDVPLVILRTTPCRWFSAGGCVMCNYELLAVDGGVSHEQICEQVDEAIAKLAPLDRYEYIFLTSQGSFFDNHEVPSAARIEIAHKLSRAGVRAVSTESEAKYCINNDDIAEYKKALGTRLSVGIGLEAADDFIRNCIINKGLPLQTFRRAADSLGAQGVGFYTYVTLGKPFLSVEEDISDAVKAIELSFACGAFMAVLEMVNLQPFTMTDALFRAGRYSPTSLWTGIATLLRLPDKIRSKVSLKGMEPDVEPVPHALSTSCPRCRERLLSGIRAWNYQRDDSILKDLWGSCECFTSWQQAVQGAQTHSVRARFQEELLHLDRYLSGAGI